MTARQVEMSRSISNTIYILSNPRIVGEYKVGIHQGGLRKLQSRYETYIPDVKVHYLIENVKAREIENQFKELHSTSRVPFKRKREGENLSEWFKMPLDLIISRLLIMLVGKDYGLNGANSFVISEMDQTVIEGTTIISPKLKVIDLTNSEETEEEEEDQT